MSHLDWIAGKLRVGAGTGRALALLLGFVLVFLFLPKPKDDPIVARGHATGIVRFASEQVAAPDAKTWIVTVQLPDGRRLKLMFPPPQPRNGEEVPLRVETYQSGDTRYFLDVQAWHAHAR